MKKLTLLVALTMMLQLSFAGGLLTNYNQSAQYVRMLARNAALEIDAVFYNPAGLVKLEDGWHFAFYSQTIFQTREIDSQFPLLNDGYYEGKTTIPVFPDLYAVYKKDKWAFSLGIGPAAGGGTAEFERGLPSFEIPISKAVPALGGLAQINPEWAVTGYDVEMALDASSVYWGIQLGATYAISDKISVFGGARLVPAMNQYEGYIKNIQLQAGGQMNAAQPWLNDRASDISGLAGQANSAAEMANGAAGSMQQIIDAGYGGATLEQLEMGGAINAQQRAQLEGGLVALGVPQEQINMMNAGQIQGAYSAAGQELSATATVLNGTSAGLSAVANEMGDKTVKTKQKGFGITPIIGINYSPNNDWTFAAKYEFKTGLTLENETEVDDIGLFPDGVEGDYDVPAILSTGIAYRGVDWLEAQLSYNIYFDQGVDWRYNVRYTSMGQMVKRESDNGHEVTAGLQFNLSDNFAFSVGGIALRVGVADSYQSDFSFANDANGFGTGIMWKITDQLVLDAGISKIWYQDETVSFNDPDLGASYNETYGKDSFSAAIGLSYSIF